MQFISQGSFLPQAELPSNTVSILPSSGFQGSYARQLTKVKCSCKRVWWTLYPHSPSSFPLGVSLFSSSFRGMNEALSMFWNVFHVFVCFLIDYIKTHTHTLVKRYALESYWPGIKFWLWNLELIHLFLHSFSQAKDILCLLYVGLGGRCQAWTDDEHLVLVLEKPQSFILERQAKRNKSTGCETTRPGRGWNGVGGVREGFSEELTPGLCLEVNWPGEEDREEHSR